MNFQTDNVQWTRNLEEFLKMLGEHSLCLSVLHKDSERHFSGKAMFIDLPVIVFSTVCGSLTLSAKNIFGEPNENDALKFTTTVIAALREGTKPEDAANLFAEDAVLFATLSGKFKTTNNEILNYFKDFLVKIPGLQSDIPIKQTVRILGPYTFGCYFYVPFHFKHRSSILNRMTFIVEYQHHHSDFKIKLLHASILPDDDYWRSSVYKYKTDYCEAGVL